jgi:anthranilate phosphoribosyltransferase
LVTYLDYKNIARSLSAHTNLHGDTVALLVKAIVEKQFDDVQAATALACMRGRGETGEEIASAARALLNCATPMSLSHAHLVDIAGTGGSGQGGLNVSTAAAFVVAAAGAGVVKHSGRSSSGVSGSVDLLESLGVKTDLNREQAEAVFKECGLVFLSARTFNPAFEIVAPLRKRMGIPTLFNIIAPLANPARPKCQLVGVFSDSLLEPVAEALVMLGVQKAYIVTSNVDEASVVFPTKAIEVRDGRVLNRFKLLPQQCGLKRYQEFEVARVNSLEDSRKYIEGVLTGAIKGYAKDTIVFNAALALVLAGLAKNVTLGVVSARKAISSGAAANLLEKYRKVSSSI